MRFGDRRVAALRASAAESTRDSTAHPWATMTADTGKRAHIKRSGKVDMALPASEAFLLFSAQGERRWVAGWNPHYVHPVNLCVQEGIDFQTLNLDVGTATWVQTRYNPASGLRIVRLFHSRPPCRPGGSQCDSHRHAAKPSVCYVSHDVLIIA